VRSTPRRRLKIDQLEVAVAEVVRVAETPRPRTPTPTRVEWSEITAGIALLVFAAGTVPRPPASSSSSPPSSGSGACAFAAAAFLAGLAATTAPLAAAAVAVSAFWRWLDAPRS